MDTKNVMTGSLVIIVMAEFLRIIHCLRQSRHQYKSFYIMMNWKYVIHWDPAEKNTRLVCVYCIVDTRVHNKYIYICI